MTTQINGVLYEHNEHPYTPQEPSCGANLPVPDLEVPEMNESLKPLIRNSLEWTEAPTVETVSAAWKLWDVVRVSAEATALHVLYPWGKANDGNDGHVWTNYCQLKNWVYRHQPYFKRISTGSFPVLIPPPQPGTETNPNPGNNQFNTPNPTDKMTQLSAAGLVAVRDGPIMPDSFKAHLLATFALMYGTDGNYKSITDDDISVVEKIIKPTYLPSGRPPPAATSDQPSTNLQNMYYLGGALAAFALLFAQSGGKRRRD